MLKERQLLRRFDALSNHALLEVFTHSNDGADDGRIVRVARDLVDKGLVNLEDDGKMAEIAEARIASAEVIYREVHSCSAGTPRNVLELAFPAIAIQ